MTKTEYPKGKLVLPDPPDSLAEIDISDISFVEVFNMSSTAFLRIYLKTSSAIDVPATDDNMRYLVGAGLNVSSRGMVTGSQAETVSRLGAGVSEPVGSDELEAEESDPAPSSEIIIPAAAKSKDEPK